jgi:N-acyl-D-aspartate/D-glutamate deacylase
MTKVDLVIRGGVIADGGGGELFEGDVAVDKGRIVGVGKVADRGLEEVDARGLLVTPGFVDIHTHYDGQVAWDSRLAPSSSHGVTTAVMGNCGVGFAPVRPGDRDRLIELMEGVEDIPGVVLREGLEWNWVSFEDYLRVIGERRYDMDVGAQLPHAPLRVFVMGERACALEPATERDVAEMRRLTSGALRAGALGFSTSRSLNHRSIKGEPTPSLKATEAELLGIAQGVADAGGGVMELASDLAKTIRDEEFAMLRRIVAQTGVSLSLGLSQKNSEPDGWRAILRLIDEAQAEGLNIVGQVAPRPVGAIIAIESSANPFLLSPTYRAALSAGDLPAKAARLRDPAVREAVLTETSSDDLGPVVGRFGGFDRLFVQHGTIDYETRPEQSLARRAAEEGQPPLHVLYDLLHQGDGQAFIYLVVNNYTHFDLGPVREMMDHPHTILGLGDGGAHVGIIMDASFPTYLMTRWSKRRHADGFDLGWLVKRQTADTARHVGLSDRGVIGLGLKADINVIDVDRLGLEAPTMTQGLPAGGLRLQQPARGYAATIVSGEIVYRNGEPTGALPGRLVRRT